MNEGERLHIGCGNTRIDGFVNMDHRRTKTTDMVAEAWDVDGFKDVKYIYARHMLEHLNLSDARRTLTAWRRALAADGVLHVVVPNIEFHARQLLGLARSGNANQEAHALAGFYGWHRGEDDAHRWGYTPASLARLLGECGFSPTNDGLKAFIDSDPPPLHINMRARPEAA